MKGLFSIFTIGKELSSAIKVLNMISSDSSTRGIRTGKKFSNQGKGYNKGTKTN